MLRISVSPNKTTFRNKKKQFILLLPFLSTWVRSFNTSRLNYKRDPKEVKQRLEVRKI